MRTRFLTWLYLTLFLGLSGVLIGTIKLWLVRYMSSLPLPSLHELTLNSIEILVGGALLLSGGGSFFVVLANWIWQDKFPLRKKFWKKD
ncbi:hypothetical protein [Paraburkholderia terrae]|uniref:hypothetical protein n=1 Tax=Paraburkholderia terrae TaxID=311230 RepID=UPI0012DFEC14|nr:hypothetical protein [Paraburkholderia terrae]